MSNPGRARTDGASVPSGLSVDRMQALMTHSWDILSLLDGEGRLLYNSPAAQRLHGFEPSDMEGRNTFDFIHPADGPGVTAAFHKCLAEPGKPVRVEYRYACKDGSWIWMEAMAVNLLDNPTIQAIVVNSRDITDRIEGKLALQDSERFADQILDTLTANLAVLDQQGRILKVNRAWRDFASANGLAFDRVWVGESYLEVCEGAAGPGSEEALAMAEGLRAMLCGDRDEFELEYPCHSAGETRWFQALVTPFKGQGPARLVVAHLNISHLKQAEETRIQLERLRHLSQKMESLGSLAGGVAHDMNNMLGAILGMASMHLELQPPETPVHDAFSIIAKAAHRGGGLVRQLLEFARQELTETREVNLNILVQEEIQLLESSALGQIQLSTDLAPDLQPIRGDSSALVHAVMNLCINAVDAMPNGGKLVLRTRNGAPGCVELEVEDSGSGMPREILDKALDPFFTTKPVGKGTGLGLSIVYGTVSAHHGSLELRSEPGKGTRVTLCFPAVEATRVGGSEAPASKPGASSRAMDILLVDDDDLIRSTLGPVIQCLGHRVTLANSGEEALERLTAGEVPHVVILDMNMPGLGGQGTLPRLRALHPVLPVFLATGRVDPPALDLARAFHGVTLVPKPFSMGELKAHLEALAGKAGH